MLPANVDPYVLQRAVQLRYKKSLFDTAKYLLGYKDITERSHLRVTETLQDDSERKLICLPRGCFKSSLVSVSYPIWILINDPNARIFIESELYTNAMMYLREIKQHLQGETFTKIFGHWKTSTWNDSEIIIEPRTRILKEPSIMVGGVDTVKVGYHYTHMILDDLCSNNNMTSQEQRRKVIDHYQLNMAILEPGGFMTICGTRYHEDDLIGHILHKELGYRTIDDMKMATNE